MSEHMIQAKVIEAGEDAERWKRYSILAQHNSVGLLRFDASQALAVAAGKILYRRAMLTYELDDMGHRRALSIVDVDLADSYEAAPHAEDVAPVGERKDITGCDV